MNTITLSTCRGAVYTVFQRAEFAWLWSDVLALGEVGQVAPAQLVLDAAARAMRAVDQGRAGEFTRDGILRTVDTLSGRKVTTLAPPLDRRHLERRLLEVAAIAQEALAAGEPVTWG